MRRTDVQRAHGSPVTSHAWYVQHLRSYWRRPETDASLPYGMQVNKEVIHRDVQKNNNNKTHCLHIITRITQPLWQLALTWFSLHSSTSSDPWCCQLSFRDLAIAAASDVSDDDYDKLHITDLLCIPPLNYPLSGAPKALRTSQTVGKARALGPAALSGWRLAISWQLWLWHSVDFIARDAFFCCYVFMRKVAVRLPLMDCMPSVTLQVWL